MTEPSHREAAPGRHLDITTELGKGGEMTATGGSETIPTDILDDVPGIVLRVALWEDGRVRKVEGIDRSFANETGHFVNSVNMVLETLFTIWDEVTGLGAAPLKSWAVRSGGYWAVGSGSWAWLLDPGVADMPAVLARVDSEWFGGAAKGSSQ